MTDTQIDNQQLILNEMFTGIDWTIDDPIVDDMPDFDIDVYIDERRAEFDTAIEWRDYIQETFPDLDAKEEYRKKVDENKKRKTGRCGQKSIKLNKKGIPYLCTFKCGICSDCLKHEALAIKKAIIELNKPLNIIACDIKEKDKEVRRLRDKGIKYQVYFDGPECHILIDSQEFGTEFESQTFDFTKWTQTSSGKRRSGNLLPPNRELARGSADDKDKENAIDSGQILTKEIVPKFEKLPDGYETIDDLMETIRYNVLSQSPNLAPTNIVEMQAAYKHRETLIIEEIRKFGGVVYGIEFFRSSMRYVTEDTPQEWLDAAQKWLNGKMVQLNFD